MGEDRRMMSRFFIFAAALVLACLGYSTAQTCTGTGDGATAGGCQCDGKPCTKVTLTDINITDGVCYWTNLAGQTPDSNQYQNSPYSNAFTCVPSDNPANTECSSGGTATAANDYYALVDHVSNGSNIAADTAKGYYQAFNVALSRYNCEEQYSHWNCDDCRKAYARWACAMTYPACEASPCEAKKPCVRVCNEVVQKCPVTLGFTCPDDNRDYSESGCNLMGLVAGASNVPASMAAMVLSAGVAL